jgi:hypothetical protein
MSLTSDNAAERQAQADKVLSRAERQNPARPHRMGLLESQNPRGRSKRTRRRHRTRVVIEDRSARRLVEQVVGEGWLTHGAVRLGQVSYAIDVWRIEGTHRHRTPLVGLHRAQGQRTAPGLTGSVQN